MDINWKVNWLHLQNPSHARKCYLVMGMASHPHSRGEDFPRRWIPWGHPRSLPTTDVILLFAVIILLCLKNQNGRLNHAEYIVVKGIFPTSSCVFISQFTWISSIFGLNPTQWFQISNSMFLSPRRKADPLIGLFWKILYLEWNGGRHYDTVLLIIIATVYLHSISGVLCAVFGIMYLHISHQLPVWFPLYR